jgi:hypothetical protein
MSDPLLATLVLYTDDVVPQPIAGVRVAYYDSLDTFITEDITDAFGVSSQLLEGAPEPDGKDYIVRLAKTGISFTNGSTQRIKMVDPLALGQTNTFEFQGHIRTLPESSDSRMCLVSGYLRNASLKPIRSARMRFLTQPKQPVSRTGGYPFPGDPAVLDRDILTGDEVVATSDKNGYIEALLPRDVILHVLLSNLDLPGWSPENSPQQIHIPDAAAVGLEDVLFPYVLSIDFSPTSLSLVIGTFGEFDLVVKDNTGLLIETKDLLSKLLVFESSDPTKAIPAISGVSKLGISSPGNATAGTAEITVSRAQFTHAIRRPTIPDIIYTPPTVTITE